MSNYYNVKELRDRMRKCNKDAELTITYIEDDILCEWTNRDLTYKFVLPIEHCKPNDRLFEAAMKKAKRAMRRM